jgi:hypothetical protein
MLYAYHGSGVSRISAGGHLFVLSDQAPETAKFRTEDAEHRTEYTFAASFHSGQDLTALEDEKLPLAARAMPAALASLTQAETAAHLRIPASAVKTQLAGQQRSGRAPPSARPLHKQEPRRRQVHVLDRGRRPTRSGPGHPPPARWKRVPPQQPVFRDALPNRLRPPSRRLSAMPSHQCVSERSRSPHGGTAATPQRATNASIP